MHIYTPWPKHLWSFKMIGQKLLEELRSQGNCWQMDKRTGHGTPISHLRANAGTTKILYLEVFFLLIVVLIFEKFQVLGN